jgi:4-hydroxybenzoyl-CoA reductase subunit beta
MHLDPFELHRPTSLEEALRLGAELGTHAEYLAGGTDLLPNLKMHLHPKAHLIALDGVPELRGISLERIGAMARLADLERDAKIARAYPALTEALVELATPLVRASGTLGGNLLLETRCFFFNQSYFWRESLGFCLKADGDRCHVVPQKERCYATFSGDLAPPLMALGAQVEIASPGGARRNVPLGELYDAGGDGIRRHHLAPGELIVSVRFPPEASGARSAYRKLRVRPSFDFPELGIAAALRLRGGSVEELRLAAGGLESRPVRFDALTDALVGHPLDAAAIDRLADSVGRAVRPVHNTFLDPAYRKKMTAVFTRRALRAVAEAPGAAA